MGTIVISGLKCSLFSDSKIPDIEVKIIKSETPSTKRFFLLTKRFCAISYPSDACNGNNVFGSYS